MEAKNPIANPLIVLREEFDDWAILFDPDTATRAEHARAVVRMVQQLHNYT